MKHSNQKQKLLYIRELFLRRSDETHGITMEMLLSFLSSHGVDAERKSIYDDINILRDEFGMDIRMNRSRGVVTYRLLGREFELAELKLLTDAVQSSRFITGKKSATLIKKLKAQCSDFEGEQLSRQLTANGKIKNMTESIYYNVDALFGAIASDSSVTFRYYRYTAKKTKEYRHDGALYRVSPFGLVYEDGNYYLIAFDEEHGEIRHYRVDRMSGIEQTGERREGEEAFAALDLETYSGTHFGMFGGETKKIRLRFPERLTDAIIDRFGTEIYIRQISGETCEAFVDVAVSRLFYGWVSSFGGEIGISAPADIRDEYRSYLCTLCEAADRMCGEDCPDDGEDGQNG